MKTSGLPQQPSPSASKTTGPSKQDANKKTESKPQKEFKEVLDDKKDSGPMKGKSTFGKPPQKGLKGQKEPHLKEPKEHPGHSSVAPGTQKPVAGKGEAEEHSGFSEKEEVFSKKLKEQDLKEFQVPTHMMMGPASIQNKAEIQKVSGPALNIREIESIVQKVQVGINEKGLPEMNFELMTDKLGSLNLKVSSENDKINIQFVTQDASAQAELQKGITELSQLLGQRGLNLAETNVMTRDQQSGQQQQGRDRGQSDSSGPGDFGKGRTRKRIQTGRSDDGFTV